jgi:hypothetical protein
MNRSTSSDFVEVIGVLVSPRGLPRTSRRGRASDPDRVTDLPGFGRVGYLAVSDTELAIFRTTKTSMHPGLRGEPLTRVPLTDLIGVGLDERRVVSFLELRFADDAVWTLQIGLIHRPAARQLAAHLRPSSRSGPRCP